MLWKCRTQYANKLGKLSSGHGTGKGQFSFQFQRKAMPKNVRTTTQLHSSHTLVKVMLKILQAELQQYMNSELPDAQAGFRKGRGKRDQTANIHWIIEKQESSRKTFTSALLTVPKPLTVWITTNCGKFWKRWDYQNTWAASRENLYTDQDATVRTGHGKTDWFQIGKGARQGCILSPCLFNLYAEYIMQNTRLDEAQAGIKIARRNINNLRYADDTTLMAETKEPKSLLMKVKEESEKVGLNSTFKKLRSWHLVPLHHGK